jgi:RNA polymerase sigma factor (sigma-70 family)
MELYDRTLARQASRALPAHMDPENAVAETWYQAYRHASRYDPRWPPYPWLAAICARTCLHQRRGLARLLPRLLLLPASAAEVGRGRAERAEERHEVRAALLRLPWRQRQILSLRFLFDVSIAEIAALLDRSPKTVESLLLRGLERLRRGSSAPTLELLRSSGRAS